jgi:hypothetical protein
MAQTTIASPQTKTPAYNPIKFIVDSTNNNLSGFKYIFDVYEAGTSNKIGEYKVLPEYGTGYGVEDLSKLLQTKVSWDLDTVLTSSYGAPNSYYKYDVKVGEEYVAEFAYTSSLTNASGNVQINVTNTFASGDQVVITQDDGGVANPQLEGLHTVISATGSIVVVNVSWSTITDATINGSVKYADNRKVITRDITEFNDRMVFNAAFKWLDWSVFDNLDYKLDNPSALWLTNQPTTDFHCTLGQDLYLNLMNPKGTDRVFFQNSNGDIFYKTISSLDDIVQVPVGPNNYGILVGTGDLIDNSVTYYDVWFNNTLTVSAQDSVKYRITLDRRVLISEYHILFLDRMGSWSSFAFQLKSYERGDVTREVYNQDVAGYVNASDEWTYNTEEFGFRIINTNVIKSFDLNTNWMTENMAQYFEELVTSPQTFLKIVTYVTTEDGVPLIDEDGCPIHIPESTLYQPCIVNNNQYEVFKQRNKNLIKQSISVRLANQDNING